MQVKEMLQKAELEVQEALEQNPAEEDSQGDDEAEEGDTQRQRQRIEVDGNIEEEIGLKYRTGGTQVARVNDESDEEEEEED